MLLHDAESHMKLSISHRNELPGNNILNAKESTVLIPINTVGAMGTGVALAVKDKYPKVYHAYRKRCFDGLDPNTLLFIKPEPARGLILIPTKIDWRDPSPLNLILDNLKLLKQAAAKEFNTHGNDRINSIACPPLGMGCGWIKGTNQHVLREAIFECLSNIPFKSTYYGDN